VVWAHGNHHVVIIPRAAPTESRAWRGRQVYLPGFPKSLEAWMHNVLKSISLPNSTTVW